MAINQSKIIELLDKQAGTFKETIVDHDAQSQLLTEDLAGYPRDAYGEMTLDYRKYNKVLTEAATGWASTANFPDLLRSGLQFDVFSGFNETATTYERIVRRKPSTKMSEEYGDDTGLGLPGIVPEGAPYPEAAISLGGGKIIPNHKRGYIIPVTEELQRFDMLGKVRDIANQMGRAFRMGREQTVMNVLTNTANYNVLNLNDQAGNNTQDLDFTPTNVNLVLALMLTQKDRTSGQYLGVRPNTLVVAPLLERFSKMLLTSADLVRAGGSATNEVYGQGQNNPFFGTINQIIVSPMFGATYEWALIDNSRAIFMQEVDGLQVLTESAGVNSESWFNRDVIRFKARDWYGCGMRDDRFAFFSNNTTAPAAS
jgi:hypothetical protein